MNKKINLMRRSIVSLAVTAFIVTTMVASGKDQIFLGPAESGTWSGSSKWPNGMYGAASTSYDFEDHAGGVCAFVISNTVAGAENKADWRCEFFSLGPAAGGARPIIFSFAYKLSDRVAAKNNIIVLLRFYDSTGTNFIGQQIIPVGAHTSDSAMTDYRTLTINGIRAPTRARTIDIAIVANQNANEPWVSGVARFDDFSVTTLPRSLRFKMMVGTAVLLGVCTLTLLLVLLWRRRNAG
jgi:hypothetical protein